MAEQTCAKEFNEMSYLFKIVHGSPDSLDHDVAYLLAPPLPTFEDCKKFCWAASKTTVITTVSI